MNRLRSLFAAAVLGCVAVVFLAGPAAAQMMRPGPDRPSPYPPNRMPGWDWWRIYPWSPYNYGRNPYNPAIVPYPYPYPYPVPADASPYYTNDYLNGPSAPKLAEDTNQHVLIPHETGPLRVPYPGTAVIQVRVPDQLAEVSFDDQKTSSIGQTRYFATPELPAGKTHRYTITASWKKDGKPVSEERQVEVTPGKTVHVDFTQPTGKAGL